ncbi:hypothetical protein GW17_00024323 [Ensete ventricosum]|nr:hypothetical protein GW17_00024323 [Ensete ventricosum]
MNHVDGSFAASLSATTTAAVLSAGHGTPSPKPPWLMVPGSRSGDADEDETPSPPAESTTSPTTSSSRSPFLRELRCVGSSDGWLFIINDLGKFSMFNPITEASILLPPVTTFPGVDAVLDPSSDRIHRYALHDTDNDVDFEPETTT